MEEGNSEVKVFTSQSTPDQDEANQKKRKAQERKQDSDEEDETEEFVSEIVIPDSLNIIYDDGKFLAVSKISGLNTIPSSETPHSVESIVSKQLSQPVYHCHRLDKVTSGVVLLARNKAHPKEGRRAITDRNNSLKEYLVLCKGVIPESEFSVDKSLHNQEKKKYQDAKTEFKKIAEFADATLIAAHLKTGKFHQIRRHLHSIDHPIVLLDGRIFLHAYKLEFIHPFTKKKVEIRDPLPSKLLEHLKTLVNYDINEEIIKTLL